MTVSRRNELPPPLLILGLPRSYTSAVCTMVGQHPEMYGLPETHLLCEETMAAWLARAARAPWPMADGLLRAIAQLYFGVQTEATVRLARQWLATHSQQTTDELFRLLADRVFPLILVDKSPSMPDSLRVLSRVRNQFPNAHFIHLLRHPIGYGQSVMKLIDAKRRFGPIPPSHWLVRRASSRLPDGRRRGDCLPPVLDPQGEWYFRNGLIRDFLRSVPLERQLRVRAEDLFADPDHVLKEIAGWMGVRTDVAAIEQMRHPEKSPFARLGPPGAIYGNDSSFLCAPVLRPVRPKHQSLDGPVPWLPEAGAFGSEVKALAREFGYE